MDENVRLVWLTTVARSTRSVCAATDAGGANGTPPTHQALAAIIGGAITGALTKMSRCDVYTVVQRLADGIAEEMIEASREQAAKEKGQSK